MSTETPTQERKSEQFKCLRKGCTQLTGPETFWCDEHIPDYLKPPDPLICRVTGIAHHFYIGNDFLKRYMPDFIAENGSAPTMTDWHVCKHCRYVKSGFPIPRFPRDYKDEQAE